MRVPVMSGVIDRRILVNYRVDPEVLRRVLPAPFRPKLVDGYGMAGICLIRLKDVRPELLPAALGLGSENAAHRIAVEWDRDGRPAEGVYVPRRDTSSRLNVLAGGRLFPGEQHHARFDVVEGGDRFRIGVESDDGTTRMALDARVASAFGCESVFPSLAAASSFFERDAVGYSATARGRRFDGIVLEVARWAVTPLVVERVESSFFDDPRRFPPGSVTFDCGLLMRDVQHRWRGLDPLVCAA